MLMRSRPMTLKNPFQSALDRSAARAIFSELRGGLRVDPKQDHTAFGAQAPSEHEFAELLVERP